MDNAKQILCPSCGHKNTPPLPKNRVMSARSSRRKGTCTDMKPLIHWSIDHHWIVIALSALLLAISLATIALTFAFSRRIGRRLG